MTPEAIALLGANVDRVVELDLLDGTTLVATPLFVYTGEENPDVFLLPTEGGAPRSVLLAEIADVRTR